MRKTLLNVWRLALVALFAVMGVAQSWAQTDCYSVGKAYCILNDKSGTFPVDAAGQVFVSLTAEETPVWTDGSYTSAVAVNNGNAKAGTVKQKFYFWAKAKPGYKFIGWNTSKTGVTPSGGSADYEGKPWGGETATGAAGSTTTYAHFSAGTEATPQVKTLYAIFEKTAQEEQEPTGVGAAFVSANLKGLTGLSFSEGSMSSKPTVKITFAENVNYTKAPDPGQYPSCVNKDVVKFVTVTCNETSKALSSTDFTVSANGTCVPGTTDIYVGEEGYVAPHYENGYGAIQLPTTLAKGTYTIHLPYGLYTTTGEKGLSNACDIVVTVTEAQQVPMAVVSTSPTENQAWDAYAGNNSKGNDNYDGVPGTVTIIFDQPIAEVIAGKTPTMVKTENNHSFKCVGYSKPILQTAQAKSTLNVQFTQLPSGTFKATIPAGIVKTATGVFNDEIVINFSVKANDYNFDEWTLPEYTHNTTVPSKDATVESLKDLTISFTREGYASPVAIKGNPVIKFEEYVEDWSGIDPDAAEANPKVITTDLHLASTLSVEDGKVVVTLNKEYKSASDKVIMVSIPADIVYNVQNGASLTPQQLCENNGCKSPAMSFKLNLKACGVEEMPLTSEVAKTEQYGYTIWSGETENEDYVIVAYHKDGDNLVLDTDNFTTIGEVAPVSGTVTETQDEEGLHLDAEIVGDNGITYHITATLAVVPASATISIDETEIQDGVTALENGNSVTVKFNKEYQNVTISVNHMIWNEPDDWNPEGYWSEEGVNVEIGEDYAPAWTKGADNTWTINFASKPSYFVADENNKNYYKIMVRGFEGDIYAEDGWSLNPYDQFIVKFIGTCTEVPTPEISMGESEIVENFEDPIPANLWEGVTVAYYNNNLGEALAESQAFLWGAVELRATQGAMYKCDADGNYNPETDTPVASITTFEGSSDYESVNVFSSVKLEENAKYAVIISEFQIYDRMNNEVLWTSALTETVAFTFETTENYVAPTSDLTFNVYTLENKCIIDPSNDTDSYLYYAYDKEMYDSYLEYGYTDIKFAKDIVNMFSSPVMPLTADNIDPLGHSKTGKYEALWSDDMTLNSGDASYVLFVIPAVYDNVMQKYVMTNENVPFYKIEYTIEDGKCANPTGIASVSSAANVKNAVIYNLAGQRVNAKVKGIVVANGKKYMVK